MKINFKHTHVQARILKWKKEYENIFQESWKK